MEMQAVIQLTFMFFTVVIVQLSLFKILLILLRTTQVPRAMVCVIIVQDDCIIINTESVIIHAE